MKVTKPSAMVWLVVSPVQVEQMLLTLICAENVIAIRSPDSICPGLEPPFAKTTFVTVRGVTTTSLEFPLCGR